MSPEARRAVDAIEKAERRFERAVRIARLVPISGAILILLAIAGPLLGAWL